MTGPRCQCSESVDGDHGDLRTDIKISKPGEMPASIAREGWAVIRAAEHPAEFPRVDMALTVLVFHPAIRRAGQLDTSGGASADGIYKLKLCTYAPCLRRNLRHGRPRS
jgi:hypothetical protein